MAYPLTMSDFPPLAELSLNDSRRPVSRRPTSHVQSISSHTTFTFPAYQMQGQDQQRLSRSSQYHSRWSVPGWQSTLCSASDSIPPLHANGSFEASSCMPYPRLSIESLFLPRLSPPDLDLPASPSDTCSSTYSDLSPSPPPSLHVVCDIPVVAPRPLPYHSPTFLQFDLPDVDEDLSHPPYIRGPTNRKRKAVDDLDDLTRVKRHAASPIRHSASHLVVHGIETRAVRRRRNR